MSLRPLALTLALAAAFPAGADVLPQGLGVPTAGEAAEIAVVVRPNLRHTRNLPRSLREARKAMLDGQATDPDALRRIADYNDGLAAWHYAKHLRDTGGAPSEIAHYAGIAVGTGRIYALKAMIDAMRGIEPGSIGSGRVNHLISVLYPQAWAGNPVALAAVAEFNGEGRLFGPMSQRTRERLLEHAAPLEGRIELEMAMRLLRGGDATDEELSRAAQLLMRVQGSEVPGIAAAARNLLPLLRARMGDAQS